MLKKAPSFLLFFCFFLNLNATPILIKSDSLLKIFKLKNQRLKERKLVDYVLSLFDNNPVDSLSAAKIELDALLLKYDVENKIATEHFVQSIYQSRTLQLNDAENVLIRSIDEANKNNNHYLLYAYFTQLAFLQTTGGNTIEAVSSFRMAKKEATTLDDAYLKMLIDINISDIYYRNNLYNQSLFYLDQAHSFITRHRIKGQRFKNIIYYNKAENYFRMRNSDSLKKYNKILNAIKSGTYKLYIYKKRTDYYLSLLQHDYNGAIKRITTLKKDTLYRFDSTDEQNLADAYYNAGMSGSAKHIIIQLLNDPEQNNHPEIKFHLYQVLAQIAEKTNNYKQAAYNFKMALQQSENQISRLTQVGNISTKIKLDEMKEHYVKQEIDYKKERVWLIFMVVVSLLSIVIVAMFYRNTKQKIYYEKLLFSTQKKELAFINSHEVRKHFSNILGIINMIKDSENKHQEYLQAEDHLLCAAESLDTAIKSISKKLDN